jgi:hypothetical protein
MQYTGLSPLGWNGTWVILPHVAQTAGNISRGPCDLCLDGVLPFRCFLADLQSGQRFGSLEKPFSAKNSCSAAENTKVFPQSWHVSVLS